MIQWLTRMPETLKQARELVVETLKAGLRALENGYGARKYPPSTEASG